HRLTSALRSAITSASDLAEAECLTPLLDLADSPAEARKRMADQALRLVRQIRSKPRSTAERLMVEYSLSSEEGLALMRLAEAFLRIPDTATRDALIVDK